jgi:starch-binding outer membrane protein, SusD/RagB family
MKRKYLSIIVSCFILVMIAGCIKKPLDVQPVGVYTNANYWRNQSDVIAGINGIYNVLT